MPDALRFSMDARKDLSSRPDFTYDLMKDVGDRIKEAVEAVPEVIALRDRAMVVVSIRPALKGITVDFKVTPTVKDDISQDVDNARAKIKAAIDGKIRETIGGSIQRAITGARARM